MCIRDSNRDDIMGEKILFQKKSVGYLNEVDYVLQDEERNKKSAITEEKLKLWCKLHQDVLM